MHGRIGSGGVSDISDELPSPARQKSKHAHRDGACRSVGAFSKPLSVLLIVYALAAFVTMLLSAYAFADPRLFDEEALAAADPEADRVLILVAVAFFLSVLVERALFFTCAFFVARFTFRSMKNLYTVGSRVPEHSPAATIYWYIVPFANFVVPASVMSQLYQGSVKAVGKRPVSDMIQYWWTAWVIALVAGVVSGNRYMTLDIASAAVVIGMGASALAALFLRRLIRLIADAQHVLMQSASVEVFS
jgi:hypothetical protein